MCSRVRHVAADVRFDRGQWLLSLSSLAIKINISVWGQYREISILEHEGQIDVKGTVEGDVKEVDSLRIRSLNFCRTCSQPLPRRCMLNQSIALSELRITVQRDLDARVLILLPQRVASCTFGSLSVAKRGFCSCRASRGTRLSLKHRDHAPGASKGPQYPTKAESFSAFNHDTGPYSMLPEGMTFPGCTAADPPSQNASVKLGCPRRNPSELLDITSHKPTPRDRTACSRFLSRGPSPTCGCRPPCPAPRCACTSSPSTPGTPAPSPRRRTCRT